MVVQSLLIVLIMVEVVLAMLIAIVVVRVLSHFADV